MYSNFNVVKQMLVTIFNVYCILGVWLQIIDKTNMLMEEKNIH